MTAPVGLFRRVRASVTFRARKRARRLMFRLVGWTRRGRKWIFSRYATGSRLASWGSSESLSGVGSTMAATERVRAWLPTVWRDLEIRTLLDIPCGDGNWIRSINGELEKYVGADLVPQLIEALRSRARSNERFVVLDLVTDALPRADAVLCRDALVHFSDEQAVRALSNIKNSGARYLIATTFPGRRNVRGRTGDWRPMDLGAPPFGLGDPIVVLTEGCTERDGALADKALAVWSL